MNTLKIKWKPQLTPEGDHGDVRDPGGRVSWEYWRYLANKGFLKNKTLKGTHFLEQVSKEYVVVYKTNCTTMPTKRHLPNFSIVLSEEGKLHLAYLPISCHEYLRKFVFNTIKVVGSIKEPLRLFVELPEGRPTFRMKRALKMAQFLTSFVGEDPSQVKLYKAKVAGLAKVNEDTKKLLVGYDIKDYPRGKARPQQRRFNKATLGTGFMSINRNRLYVLEASNLWLTSPYLLSVFGRFVRDAMFKNPTLFLEPGKKIFQNRDYIEKLRKWEGLVPNKDAFYSSSAVYVRDWERALKLFLRIAARNKGTYANRGVWNAHANDYGVAGAGIDRCL